MNATKSRCIGVERRQGDRGFPLRRWGWTVLLLLGIQCAACPPCWAQALEVQATVDKDVATLEDQITLTVSVSGDEGGRHVPRLPSLPDFHVVEGGTSSRIEIVNFRKSASVEHRYFLLPRKAGTFTIGPVRVQSDGQTAESRPVQVRILPADQTPEERPPVFITQEVDEEAPYLNQQVLYTFRFYQSARVVEAQWGAPDFQGFWVEDLGKERSYETVLGGRQYSVTEIRRALFPLESGPRQIPESTLTCKLLARQRRPLGGRSLFDEDFFSGTLFGGLGQTESKILRSKPIALSVRPLPAEGRPPGFQGLVGSFQIQASVGDREVRKGESTTLTLTVSGEGNLRDLLAVGPEAIPGFKIYPDKPSFDLRIQGNKVQSTRVFKIALVPLEEGALEVPSVEVAFFDPSSGSYRAARTGPIRLSVTQGEASDTLPPAAAPLGAGRKSIIQIVGQDILPIHTGQAGARPQVPAGPGLVPYFLVLLAPPLATLLCFAVKRRKDRLEGDPHLARKKEARRRAEGELREARKRIGDPGDRSYFGLLSRSIKGLIGDKRNLSARAFTPAEVRRCLEEAGLPPDTVNQLHAFLEEMEYSQFVSGPGEAGQREAQYRRAKKFVSLLDRKL